MHCFMPLLWVGLDRIGSDRIELNPVSCLLLSCDARAIHTHTHTHMYKYLIFAMIKSYLASAHIYHLTYLAVHSSHFGHDKRIVHHIALTTKIVEHCCYVDAVSLYIYNTRFVLLLVLFLVCFNLCNWNSVQQVHHARCWCGAWFIT